MKVIYPGSFDPITKGHLDIIKRSSKLFDNVIIGVFVNVNKKSWFTIDERIKLIKKVLKNEGLSNVEVVSCSGLLVNYIKENDIDILIRGLRAVSDYEYELQVNLTNSILATKFFETIFLTASREFLYLSSSVVKEIALNHGDLSKFVPRCIIKDISKKVADIKNEQE